MTPRNYAKDVEDTLADRSIITVKVGYRCFCGTADAPRDGEGRTRAIPMALAV